MSIRTTDSLRDPTIDATLDIEQQISLLEIAIRPLKKLQKKLSKLEDELANTNSLIDSGIGSKADKAALRQAKRDIRQRRVQMRKELEALPILVQQREDLLHDLDVLRRRHGILWHEVFILWIQLLALKKTIQSHLGTEEIFRIFFHDKIRDSLSHVAISIPCTLL